MTSFDKHKAPCKQCGIEFTLNNRNQLGALNRGLSVFCSKKCRIQNDISSQKTRPGRHLCGPCPTCGETFHSRVRSKAYCSMKCYVTSPELKERLQSLNDTKKLPETKCQHCGDLIINKHAIRKFCSVHCRRSFYAERFDRFVANPESLALPQCYDEFLTQETLPCLVEGCDWVGVRLGQHCNITHGIPVEKLREMAGFNRTTGMCTTTESKNRSVIAAKLQKEGKTCNRFMECRKTSGNTGKKHPPRLESLEHSMKTSVEMSMTPSKTRPPSPCKQCGINVSQMVIGKKLYCSIECRREFYRLHKRKIVAELICSLCGAVFSGSRDQSKRAKNGTPICCSGDCRNKLNITACLEKRRTQQEKDS